MRTLCWLSLLLLAGCAEPPTGPTAKAIIGASLIDGTGAPPIEDAVIIVAGSRIRAAGPRAVVPIPAGAEKLDGTGLWVTPGLIDLHVHLGAKAGPRFDASEYTRERIERNLAAYLAYGITAVRSVGTEREAGFAVRQAIRDGSLAAPALFTAGRGFTAPGGHPSQEIGDIARQPADAAGARQQVSELAAQRADLIKIWIDDLGGTAPKIRPEVTEAILAAAREANIPVVAHIHSLADALHLTRNGAAGFLHMVRDTEDLPGAALAEWKEKQIVFAPTLVRQELAWLFQEQPALLDDPVLAATLEPGVLDAVRAAKSEPSARAREEFARAIRNTGRAAKAGVPIGAGSDGGSAIDFPGWAFHRELELLVQAGLSPLETVTAATRNGALALGQLAERGTVETGKRADLVIVRGNPLEDIRRLRAIERVMLGGQWVER
ncbi:MAG: amidohydrolase family protein [Bryobacterales bacterium]|nr:amidohydrolase family protein [Bryobacterales bacterium]